MSAEFRHHMIETRYVEVICSSCEHEQALDVSSTSEDGGIALLNAVLNKEGWALEGEMPLCPDCKEIPAKERLL